MAFARLSAEEWRQVVADLREVTEAVPVDRRTWTARTLFFGFVGNRRFVVIRDGVWFFASWNPGESPECIRFILPGSLFASFGLASFGPPVLIEGGPITITVVGTFLLLYCGCAVYSNLKAIDSLSWSLRYMLDRSVPRDTPEPPKPKRLDFLND